MFLSGSELAEPTDGVVVRVVRDVVFLRRSRPWARLVPGVSVVCGVS